MMHQTLSQHRVGVRASHARVSEPNVVAGPVVPARPKMTERIKRTLKNPLVLVGITWIVMAVLLAREIFAR